MTKANKFETRLDINDTHNPEKMDDKDDAVFENKPIQNIVTRLKNSLRENIDRCRNILNEK
jgi:hypothetical protein